jgi:hypothetical protein
MRLDMGGVEAMNRNAVMKLHGQCRRGHGRSARDIFHYRGSVLNVTKRKKPKSTLVP